MLVIRLLLAASCNLLPDEAFYWVWTRHLAGGYLDHPPMIAYLMWLSTRVLGDTQIGVRMPCVLMSLASIALNVALARRQLKDDRARRGVAGERGAQRHGSRAGGDGEEERDDEQRPKDEQRRDQR